MEVLFHFTKTHSLDVTAVAEKDSMCHKLKAFVEYLHVQEIIVLTKTCKYKYKSNVTIHRKIIPI